MICLTPKPIKTFFVYRIQSKDIFFINLQKMNFLGKRRGLNKKQTNEKKAF